MLYQVRMRRVTYEDACTEVEAGDANAACAIGRDLAEAGSLDWWHQLTQAPYVYDVEEHVPSMPAISSPAPCRLNVVPKLT